MTDRAVPPRPLPPPLAFDDPPCSVCGEGTHLEDGAYTCDRCGASWDAFTAADEPGGWDGDETEQCPSQMRPYADQYRRLPESMRGRTYRCALTVGHDKRHLHPEWQRGWTNAEAVPDA